MIGQNRRVEIEQPLVRFDASRVMMRSTVYLLLTLVLLSAPLTLAQTDRRSGATPAEIAEWNRRDDEQRERLMHPTTVGQPSLFERFAGFQTGNWTVSLISEGGLLGSITLFAINSEGKLLCGEENGKAVVEDAPLSLVPIAGDVADGGLSTKAVGLAERPKGLSRYCSDCSYESFVVYRREANAWRSMKYPYAKADVTLRKLYEQIPANGGCKGR